MLGLHSVSHRFTRYACSNRRAAVVKQLLARNDVGPNVAGIKGWGTPLLEALSNSDTEIINLLLAKDGIDVNVHSDVYFDMAMNTSRHQWCH
jgi:ankyrin repeat protein